tara:strand:- start:160 stop:318 length:159 start_codon:yes stop_codon:yes gene_type:complete
MDVVSIQTNTTGWILATRIAVVLMSVETGISNCGLYFCGFEGFTFVQSMTST